jgi:hypothetical protein
LKQLTRQHLNCALLQGKRLESSRLGVRHDHPEADQIARAGGGRRLCSRRIPKFNVNYSSPRMRAASAIDLVADEGGTRV